MRGRNILLGTLTVVVVDLWGCSDQEITAPRGLPGELPVASSEAPVAALPQDQFQATADRYGEVRVSLSLEAEGAITRGEPVRFNVVASGNRGSVSSSVELHIPELEALRYSGPGKAYRAPLGRALPKAGVWSLGGLGRGARQSRSASEVFSVPGYYQVIATASANPGRRSQDDRFISDRTTVTKWLLVTEDGGQMTDDFQSELIPAGMQIGGGPFRAIERRTPPARSAGIGQSLFGFVKSLITRTPDAYVRVEYYNAATSSWEAAEEAVGYAEWWDDDPWEGGSVADTHTETVGADGIYGMTCNGYYGWFAYADLETTEVFSGQFSGNWADCGDTLTIQLPAGEYQAFVALKEIIPEIDSELGITRSQVKVDVTEFGCGDSESTATNCYSGSTNTIGFREVTAEGTPWWRYSVAQHEYGHALHYSALGGSWISGSNCVNNEHTTSGPNNHECALQEGIATWVGHYAYGLTGHSFGSNLEDEHHVVADSIDRIENNVAAFLWDIDDGGSESGDTTDYPPSYIDAILTTCSITTSGWPGQSETVPGIVWCMEKGFPSASVQDSLFPTHPEVTAYSESATEPGTWSATAVRATAEKNVGN